MIYSTYWLHFILQRESTDDARCLGDYWRLQQQTDKDIKSSRALGIKGPKYNIIVAIHNR